MASLKCIGLTSMCSWWANKQTAPCYRKYWGVGPHSPWQPPPMWGEAYNVAASYLWTAKWSFEEAQTTAHVVLLLLGLEAHSDLARRKVQWKAVALKVTLCRAVVGVGLKAIWIRNSTATLVRGRHVWSKMLSSRVVRCKCSSNPLYLAAQYFRTRPLRWICTSLGFKGFPLAVMYLFFSADQVTSCL